LLEIDQLSIGPINTPQVLNAAGLRGLIAERLLDALGARLARDAAPGGGG
jgi:hypothetical protein